MFTYLSNRRCKYLYLGTCVRSRIFIFREFGSFYREVESVFCFIFVFWVSFFFYVFIFLVSFTVWFLRFVFVLEIFIVLDVLRSSYCLFFWDVVFFTVFLWGFEEEREDSLNLFIYIGFV